ncbi:uncharacterized protein [Gossypium hirsutum]|uniref:DUF4219 domain-containing protein n=1 Tax=Gossypium hirsutum TaxID=3635 RepID=A0A1U8HVC2_GOSHI|nr:uncharacterized protein LOC107887549 [Gossypium hirsutum]
MSSSRFSPAPPPIFNIEGYHIWVVKMKTYLQAFDLWEVFNSDVKPAPLRANPTMAQIRQHADERTKRQKAMSCIQNRTERIRQQQLLNLKRDFENLKMKEKEIVKQYSDRIMDVVNSIRLLGEQFSEARIVEKVISTLPKRYEAKISSLEDLRDLSSISLTKLINVLYAQEQRKASRLEEHQEGAFQAKSRPASNSSAYKGKKTRKDKPRADGARRYPPYPHCRRLSHLGEVCWFRPDVQCKICKKSGHAEKVCRNKGKQRPNQTQQPRAEAQVAEDDINQEE